MTVASGREIKLHTSCFSLHTGAAIAACSTTVDAAVPLVSDAHPASADPADKHALQEAQAFSGGTRQHIGVSPVGAEARAISRELVPVDITLVMIADHHPPGFLRCSARSYGDLAGRPNLLGRLITSEDVDPGVGWIEENAGHAGVDQWPPNELSVPCPAIGAPRKTQSQLLEAANNAER